MDRHARKQVLLTRIAFERMELRRDLARLQEAASVPNLVRAAAGESLGKTLLAAMVPGKSSWWPLALALLRRYRVAATLAAGFLPGLRVSGRGVKRVVKIAAIASVAWFGWRAARGFSKKP
jgi:hypothetical protein